jgi:hypothetical protein
MDLSPRAIDRKQDIASWPEADIEKLATRAKNRYQKRKAAILEYFQSDLSVEEISARHRLSAADALETMARRCCALHEDGQPWGFRALVPGARVVNASVSSALSQQTRSAETRGVLHARRAGVGTEVAPRESELSWEKREDGTDEDTAERRAIKLKQLPETPIPPGIEQEDTSADASPANETLEAEAAAVPAEEVAQEDFPTLSSQVMSAPEEVEQEDFSDSARAMPEQTADARPVDDSGKTLSVENVEQEELPASVNAPEQATDEEEVEQEDFPTMVSPVSPFFEEEVAQEDFPVNENQAPSSEQHGEQEEFPRVPETTEDTETTEADVAQEDFSRLAATEQTIADDEVVQEDFPVLPGMVEGTLAGEEQTRAKAVTPANKVLIVEEVAAGEDTADFEDDEPTGKMPVVRPTAHNEEHKEAAAEESVPELTVVKEEAQTQKREEEARQAESPDKESDNAKIAELDTVEVASVVDNERLKRIASVETIKVPAAMLEALEKADRDESVGQSISASASAIEEGTDEEARALPVPSDLPVAEKTLTSGDDALTQDEVAVLPTQTLEEQRRNSQQLTRVPEQKSPTRSLVEDSRYRITGSQVAIKHAVLRRWGKQGRLQRQQQWIRVISAAVIVSILVILLIPLGVGLVGYSAYTNIKNVADDGVNNLLSIQTLIPADKNDLTSALDSQKLDTAKTNLQKAQSDFLQLQDMVNRPDIESLLQQFAPQYSARLDMARHLVQVALDVSRMGQELIGVAQMGAGVLHGGSLLSTSSTRPLFTADDVNSVEAALVHAQYYIGDIQTQMSQVNLAALPLGSASQKAKLAKYLDQIPQAQSAISQAQMLIGPVAWMLGIGATRHFLVQTLDRGELRPSGGFEGQYGLLTLQNGRMSPFSLRDITLLDYAENGNELGATPPAPYSWMNFGNFGVRDANLSADYPTTAKIVMSYFQAEGGGPLDGDIQITPVVIEQFLQITGPIQIKEYGETITAQNLEDKLHQYQQDPRLIQEQQQKTGQDTHATRKAFTNLVGTMLMDRIKHLPPSQLISFGKVLFKDLKTRDLQVYLNNPVAEQWLTQNGYSGAMPQFTNGNDGFMVVQSNISISKAAQYVKSTFKDNVTLDASGGATHNLTITLNYQQTGPVYGFNTYADYMRIYAPANAQLRSAYGFNTGSVLCTPGGPSKPANNKGKDVAIESSSGGSYQDDGITISGCSQYWNSFPDTNARSCPDGNYELGYDGMQAKAWPVSNLGGPSVSQSDLPGYAMWGGLTLTPKNCITTITLSWYVPRIVQNTPGKSPYAMIVGHQAGWPDTAQVSIDASALKGVKNLSFNQTIDVDTLVALAPLPGPSQQSTPGSGTPTPAVTPTKP